MTDAAGLPEGIVNGTTDYTITLKWNTTHKFYYLWMGWSGADVPTKTTLTSPATKAGYVVHGGLNKGDKTFVDAGVDKGGNVKFGDSGSAYAEDRQDEYGCQVKNDDIWAAHQHAIGAAQQATTTYEIVGGNLVAVYNTVAGVTFKYLPKDKVSVKGYISIFTTHNQANNTFNIQSVQIKEGAMPEGIQFPEVSNRQVLTNVDFRTIKTDAALDAEGFVVSATSAGTYNYTNDGLQLKFGTGDFLVNKDIELNNTNAYIIDFTYKMDPSVWIWAAEFGFTKAMLEGDAATVNAALTAHHGVADGNASLKMRANESDNKLAVDSWTYYKDGTFMEAETSGTYNPSATAVEAACGAEKASIRVRILVSGGTAQFAFMTIGDENFYIKRNTPMTQDSVAGLVGFTFIGGASAGRGVTLQTFNVSQCDLGDTTGGDLVQPEKDKAYTDAAATYYKDGYVLHHMDFAAEGVTWESTSYSFATNSSKDRIVKVEEGVLKLTNSGSKAAYLMFTANAIPATITEYTASYKFRFVGDINSYFGFIRGISLDEDGSRDNSKTLEITYKGEVTNCETANTDAWAAIVTAMKAGEWVEVTISNVGRYLESVTVKCGENSATFKMEGAKNKAAEEGYMGFIIGKTTAVEIASVTICAGKADNAATAIWPTGTEAGALVQNVTAEAVAEGTKPDYSVLIAELTSEGGGNTDDNPTDTNPEQTTAATTTAATTKAAEAKKGCKGSIVALPAIIATAVFGCAVVSKKKED